MFETKYRIMRNLDRGEHKPLYLEYKMWFATIWFSYKNAYGDVVYFDDIESIESLINEWLSPKKSRQEFVKNVE